MDPLTVSKTAPFLERIPKEKSENSLSAQSEVTRQYFAELKPFAKRASEERAFRGLRQDFSEEQISACVAHLAARGMPGGGESCHSPMAFLSKAMGQVLAEVEAFRVKTEREAERVRREAETAAKVAVEAERERREWEEKERAFGRAFPEDGRQREVIAELCRGMPFAPDSPTSRVLAVGRWWSGLTNCERLEATA